MTTGNETPLPDEFSRLGAELSAGHVVRRPLPHGLGWIHVDHLQPVLCVYRRPLDREDAGTGHLLAGQASYLLSDTAIEHQVALKRLISLVMELMVDTYGAALIFEIWSAQDAPTERAPPTRYRIVAEEQGAPSAAVRALEQGLLAMNEPLRAEVELDYQTGASPRGCAPLLTKEKEMCEDVFLIGLELPPIYRDPQSGNVVPKELRRFTRSFGRALRQCFYSFAHARANYRPAHFHELGPRAMTRAVGLVDRGLAEVSDAFDVLLLATPVNAEAAFEHFISDGCDKVPEFLYRSLTVDTAALKRALYQVPIETVEDPAIHYIFAAQQDELDRQITMLGDRDTRRFLLGSQQVFGSPDGQLRQIAQGILEATDPSKTEPRKKEVIGAPAFARLAEEELAHYRGSWRELPARVEVRDDVPGVMVSKGHLLIGRGVALSQDRVEPLLHHEIGTHVVTYYNGLAQPLAQFHSGMPGYEETQEGLAVLSEYLCGGLRAARLRTLAARVIATDCVIVGADFVETFRVLSASHGFGHREAFTIAMRVHRGGGLTKDIVYLRGLAALLDHLSEGKAFDDFLLGKVALEYMEIVEELRWRKIVSPGPLRPRYLDDPDALRRLRSLPPASGMAALLDGPTT